MKFKKILFLFTVLIFATDIFAIDLKDKTVYMINNANYTGRSMAAGNSGTGAVSLPKNNNDQKQQWLLVAGENGNGFYFRNVSNGAYLTSPKKTYTQWSLTFSETPDPSTMLMGVNDYNGNCIIRPVSDSGNSYGYAHNDSGHSIVGWVSTSVPSQWNFEEVPLSEAELAAIYDKFKNTADEIARTPVYEGYLDALFEDKACTRLKVSSDLENNSNYQSLPFPLRAMVDKVKSENWSETKGDWDDEHARKYRVQLYEPYSEGSAAAGLAGIQAYTNMNNPTGILGDAGDLIYIMVDSDVPEGSTLYINGAPDESMYNSVTAGTALHKGLNTIICNQNNTHYFIYYTVNTVSNGKPSQYKVTEFPPIKIHIEGGRLNGFFNYVGDELYTPDTREDYEYTSSRATHVMYDLLGKYVILHFFLEDTPDLPGETNLHPGVKSSLDPSLNPGSNKDYDPVKIMKTWDSMCFSERILMGIQDNKDIANPFNMGNYSSIVGDNYSVGNYSADPGFFYSDYFNNRMMGISMQAKGLYMNATAWRTAYAPSTINVILTQCWYDGMWGPAHEYGHMNQTPMRIAGTTEESNNVFSNVALYYSEKSTTSRCDYISDQLKVFNEGKTFLENGTWGTTRMFWQLWCYYHATKHNTKFYPRLYELLRKNPLKRDPSPTPGILNPRYDLLHFAKMCCIAAGEDLTNFFTAWGFFVPLDMYHISDYDEYDCVLTQADIDAVKQEIKDLNFPVNNSIILIDDRPGSSKPSESGHPKEKAGDLGGLDAFSKDSGTPGNYDFTLDGTTVKVSGEGNEGVGFLVFDEEGNLIGFSNSYSFELSTEAAEKLIEGKAQIQVVSSSNETVTAVNSVLDGTPETKKKLLEELIANCDEMLSYVDSSRKKVGYLYEEKCETLKALRDEAELLIKDATATGDSFSKEYKILSDEYYKVLNDGDARIKITSGASYIISNKLYPDKLLSESGEVCVAGNYNKDDDSFDFKSQWILEPGNASSGKYVIRNMADGKYAGAVKRNYTSEPLSDTPQEFTITEMGNGLFALVPDNSTSYAFHMSSSGQIVAWGYTSDASNWRLTKVNEPEYVAMRIDLKTQMDLATELLYSTGEVDGLDSYTMEFTEENVYTNAPYNGKNEADRLSSWNVIFDDNINTYFHSNYDNTGTLDNLDPYIRLQADNDDYFRNLTLSYTTRNTSNTGTNPQAFKIEASDDCQAWHEIYSVGSGLLTGAAVTNTTPWITAPENTRYLRFMVTRSGGAAGGHPYFAVSELKVENRHDLDCKHYPEYNHVKDDMMKEAGEAILEGREIYSDPASALEDIQTVLAKINEAHSVLLEAKSDISTVKEITLNKNVETLRIGETANLKATVLPDDASQIELIWKVEPEGAIEIETVDELSHEIVIKAVNTGDCVVTAQTTDGSGLYAQCRVSVLPEEVTSINLVVESNVLKIGDEPTMLIAEVTPANATPELEWIVSNPLKAEIVSTDGLTALLSPVNIGLTDVRVQLANNPDMGSTVSFKILPEIPVETITISPNSITVPLNDSGVILTAEITPSNAFLKTLRWESSDHSVVTVNESTGEVFLIGEGTAVITASSTDGTGVTGQCEITVTAPLSEPLQIIPSEVILETGKTMTFETIYLLSGEKPEISWTSSDVHVAHVDETGTVTAIGTGTAVITATAEIRGEIYDAEAVVTVTSTLAESMSIIPEMVELKPGDTTTLQVSFTPSNVTLKDVNWKSSDDAVVAVDAEGNVTAIAVGEAVISAETTDGSGVTATCKVIVKYVPVELITIDAESPVVKKGRQLQLNVTVFPENATDKTLIWQSSDPSVADVSETGLVTALSAGDVLITATAADGSNTEAKVNVQIVPPLKGDSNDNDKVTVTDAVATLNFLLGYEVAEFNFEAADVDNDNRITIADATSTVTIVLEQEIEKSTENDITRIAAYDSGCVVADDFTFDNDRFAEVNVYLDGNRNYVAIQADILVPEGMKIESVKKGSAAQSHLLTSRRIGEREMRIVLLDLNNREFKGEGSILNVVLSRTATVTGNIEIHNIFASDSDGMEYEPGFEGGAYIETSGVDNVSENDITVAVNGNILNIIGAKDKEIFIFNIDGILVSEFVAESNEVQRTLAEGTYIVRVGRIVRKIII